MNFTSLIRDEVFTFLSPLQPQEIEELVVDRLATMVQFANGFNGWPLEF